VSVFTLDAQVLGVEHHVAVDPVPTGFVVSSSSGHLQVRSLSSALRIAANGIGTVLQRAQRREAPWGLRVSVGQVATVYGAWPLLSGPPSNSRPRPSLVARIRRLWRDTDGPLAALDNAVKIVEAYANRLH
jgi:hypothetical protein